MRLGLKGLPISNVEFVSSRTPFKQVWEELKSGVKKFVEKVGEMIEKSILWWKMGMMNVVNKNCM